MAPLGRKYTGKGRRLGKQFMDPCHGSPRRCSGLDRGAGCEWGLETVRRSIKVTVITVHALGETPLQIYSKYQSSPKVACICFQIASMVVEEKNLDYMEYFFFSMKKLKQVLCVPQPTPGPVYKVKACGPTHFLRTDSHLFPRLWVLPPSALSLPPRSHYHTCIRIAFAFVSKPCEGKDRNCLLLIFLCPCLAHRGDL